MKILPALSMLWCLAPFLASPSQPARAAEVMLGMDIAGAPTKPEEQQAFVKRLHDAGVKVIRSWVLHESSLNLIREAYAAGIKVNLSIITQFRQDAKKRPVEPDLPWVYGSYPLSEADPARTAAAFEDTLNKLEAAGIVLVGFQLGGEMNNAPFNGDFAIHPPGDKSARNMGLEDLRHDPQGQRIAAGYRAMVEVLKAVRAVRDRSRLNRNTPLILGGLADTGEENPRPTARIDGVSINATIQMMREFGVDNVVDDYGVDTYPAGSHPGDQRAAANRRDALARTALAQCAPTGSGKPCWIIEWGFPNSSKSCPPDDSSRAQLVGEMMEDFKPYVKQGRLVGVLYYVWAEDSGAHQDQFTVYRCGGLTQSGRVALDSSLLR